MISVTNFTELKNAIENSTDTEISVLADITFTSGIKVDVTKSSLIIDFNNHHVTDRNSSSFTDTLYIASTTNTLSVTVKNAVWSGRNYYGVIGVYDGNTNTTIVLDNVNYSGPQFVYNKNGITKINNCTINIAKDTSSTNPQEMCEANRVIFSGNVQVDSLSTSNAVIWYTGTNSAFTVEENAVLTINALQTYLLYTDTSPTLLFKKNSKTTITTQKGLFYSTGSSSHIANSFTLEENASFVAYKTASNSVPMFKVVSDLVVESNAIFQLYAEASSTTSLIYFGKVANMMVTSPRNIVLYNPGGNVFSFQTGSASAPNNFSFTVEMLRLWDVAKTPLASAGNFLDVPTSEYYKQNYLSNLTATIKATSSALSSVDSNIESADTGYPMNTSTLKILSSKVIAMGSMKLSVNDITDISKSVIGSTNTNANVKAEYLENSVEGVSDSDGNYDIALNSTIPVDTNVKVSTNKQFLTKSINVISIGSVLITNLNELKFLRFVSESNGSVVYREDTYFSVEITDTRTTGGEWYLYVYIENPLSSGENKLQDVFVYSQSGNSQILNSTPLLIYTGKWDENQKITTISWQKIEGFLLNFQPLTKYVAGDYSTTLFWQISLKEIE